VKHPFRWIALAVGAGVCVLAVVLAVTVTSDPHADANTSRLVNRPAPSFTLTGLDGQTITSESFAGKTVLVNFWNSWCIPCAEEHAALETWYADHKDDSSVVLLGIVRDDNERAIRKIVEQKKIDWPVAFDPNGKAALDFGTRGQPETYAIGPDNVVAASQFGPVTPATLDEMVSYAQGAR
jgi:cytochrome c biogenesis protein CcmG/thiol:disulfide interchange protein DsbE